MKAPLSPKTLHLLIKANWLADSIISLGSGYLIHLLYPVKEIAPEVLKDIQNQSCGEGVLGDIIQLRPDSKRLVAMTEVSKISDQETGFRFDLRILETTPYLRKRNISCYSDYLCHYSNDPA